VNKVEENFRPDQDQDLFSLAEQEDVSELVEEDPLVELRKQAQAALQGNISAGAAPSNSSTESAMMQMMTTMMQLVTQANQPKPAPAPKQAPAPKPAPGVNVVFSGAFGRITVRYAEVKVEPAFIVLVSVPEAPTMYEPPLSAAEPISLQVDGRTHRVMSLGLSFNHKGDILLLMPLALNQEDASAEKTE